MTLEEFMAAADEVWAGVPPPLTRELSGGLLVSAGVQDIPGPGSIVALGEYQVDVACRRIVLYYGSFLRALGEARAPVWRKRIGATIRHELRHHIETLAGRADLAREDQEMIAGWRGG